MTTAWSTWSVPYSNGAAWDAGVVWESRRTKSPTDLAATVAYIRDQVLRTVNGPAEDEHITRLIKSATAVYEEYAQKALMPQEWEMILDRFPPGPIRLERPPLLSLTRVTIIDELGAAQDLDPADYLVKPSGAYRKAELWPPPPAGAWPTTQGGRPDAITITYQAGVGPDLTLHPELEREIEGIALLVSECYTHRLLMVEARVTSAELKLDRFWKRAW